MFSVLGVSNMEPFVITAYNYCFSVGPTEVILNPEYENRKIGVFAMFLLLIVISAFYLLYKLVKKSYYRYIASNKIIKE